MRGVWLLSVCVFFSFSCLCLFVFCSFLCFCNHSPTHALMSICNKMCKHRAKANKQQSLSRRTDYIGLCDPLNCAEEGLKNNCWSSQLSTVWRPQRAKFLRLNLSFLQQQEVGYSNERLWRVCLRCSFWISFEHTPSHHSSVIVSLSWCLFDVSPLALSGHSGKGRCWLLPKGNNCSTALSWKCFICIFLSFWIDIGWRCCASD